MELGKLSTAGLCLILFIILVLATVVSVFIGAVSIPFDTVIDILGNKMFGFGDTAASPTTRYPSYGGYTRLGRFSA